MEPITVTFQPTRRWIYRAYWLKNVVCKTARNLNFLNILTVVSTSLILWLLYRAVHPDKLMFWSSQPIGNALFAVVVLLFYTAWEYGRLLAVPFIHHHSKDTIGIDIVIGGNFTSYVETKGNTTSKTQTFTARWQDLAELTLGKHSILFSFLSYTNGYHVIMIPRNTLTADQLEELQNYQPPSAGFKHLLHWYFHYPARHHVLIDGVGLLITVICADWVFF